MSEARLPPAAYSAGQGDPIPRRRRNPRRAYDREGREIRPMDLATAAHAMRHRARTGCVTRAFLEICGPGTTPTSAAAVQTCIEDHGETA